MSLSYRNQSNDRGLRYLIGVSVMKELDVENYNKTVNKILNRKCSNAKTSVTSAH